MTAIAIAGVAGRMGKTLVEAIAQSEEDLRVVAGSVLAEDPARGMDIGLLSGVGPSGVQAVSDLAAQADAFDVLIDFTSRESTLANLQLCREQGKAIVIGTTGFSEEEKQVIEAA